MKVGVLEDNPVVRGMLSEMLELAGHSVSLYECGLDFLACIIGDTEKILPPHFDVALIDLLLSSSMSGLEVINHMSVIAPDLPIIVISAANAVHLEQIKDKHPEVQTLQKPFKMQDLLDLLDRNVCIR